MKKYYSYDRVNSYNCFFNFIMSPRGNGKTYGAKRSMIKDFLKNGNEAVYVRRYNTEMKRVKKSFFKDIQEEFKGVKFEVKGDIGYINGKEAIYFIPLSTSQQLKSSAFPKVTKIFYDEFVIDKKHIRYITDEVLVFLDLVETIGRDRNNLKCYFLANSISIVNPYFSFFDFKFDAKKRFNLIQEDVILELFKDEDIIEAKKQTRFGKLIANTKYGKYSIENEFLLDNEEFILPKQPKGRYIITFIYRDRKIGVFMCEEEGFLYFTDKIEEKYKYNIAITTSDHSINTMMLGAYQSSQDIKYIKQCFCNGFIRFKNQEVKSDMYDIARILNIR